MESIILYGMGSWVDNHYLWLKKTFNIVGVYDKDSLKRQKAEDMNFYFYTLEELETQEYDAILITSTYEKEISGYLKKDLHIHKTILSGNELYRQWELEHSPECLIKMGDQYSENSFSVIQCGDETGSAGLLGLFCVFIREISNAVNKNRIPVVDMKNFYNIYHENWEQVGKLNTWELFFKQPYEEYSMNDIEKAACVYFSEKKWNPPGQKDRMARNVIYDKKLRKEYHDVYTDYMKLSDKVAEEYSIKRKELIEPWKKQKEKILGVSIRGTDYRLSKPYLHDIQPSLEQVAEKIQEAFIKWGITKIYVNSDEEKSIHYIKEKFDGKVISMDYQRFDSYETKKHTILGQMRFERPNDAYRRGADYLISTLLLAECDCFIGSINGGCIATLIMTNGFQNEYIFDDLGVYGIDDDAYIFTPDGKPIYIRKQELS